MRATAPTNVSPAWRAPTWVAGIGGIAELAIRRMRPFVSGKFWEAIRELKRQVLAETPRTIFQ